MALTRPTFNNILTTVVSLSDPLTVLHSGATAANVDVGFLINRANGLVSNVALYWNESGQSFVTAFTANTGTTDTNVSVTSYASLITGGITASGNIIQTGTGYHTIPVGNTAQRPGTATSGMIRYNTTLSSFEGYGSAWSSLGGVKSVDGNTYILAEATVGAGDNTLWFYNNATNTARLSTSNLTLLQSTTSTSATTGALIVAGGAGIAGNLYIGGNLTVLGASFTINSTSLSIQDPIVNLNTPSDLTPLTSATTQDIGLKFHYYDTVDSAAFLGRTTSDGFLTWYSRGTDTANVFTGTVYGTVKTGAMILANTTPATLANTGALQVWGGASVSGNLLVPTLYGNISPTPGLTTVYTTGHVVPTANVTYDLGTKSNRFRSLYLSGSTIYLGNATITTSSTGDIIINNTGSFAVPVGTTDQRSSVQGAIRYNTTISAFESYDGTTWNKLAYGTVSDFPNGDYGDLTILTDAFGVSTSTTYDCNASGAVITADLAAAGTAQLNPI